MNDLLREGIVVPDAPSRIPAAEVFWVSKEDASVWIYDAFYANGPTADQDPALLALVRDLYRTSFDSLP